MRVGDLKVHYGPFRCGKLSEFAQGMAEAAKKLHYARLLAGPARRPGVILPTWEWWEIRKHLRADWRRYQKSRAARKKRRHYMWVNDRY